MIRRFFFPFLLLFASSQAFDQELNTLGSALRKNLQDTSAVNIQLKLADYYIYRDDGMKKNDVDSSRYYIQSAKSLSEVLGLIEYKWRALQLEAQLEIRVSNFQKASMLITTVAAHYRTAGNYLKEAAAWHTLGGEIRYNDIPHLKTRIEAFRKAHDIYIKHNYKLLAAIELKDIADVDYNLGNLGKAEAELLSVINQFKELKFANIYRAYYLIARVYHDEDDYFKEIINLLECIKTFEADKNRSKLEGITYYHILARSYFHYEKYNLSVLYFHKTLDIAFDLNDRNSYYICQASIVEVLKKQKKYKEALLFLQAAGRKLPAQNDQEQGFILSAELLMNVKMNNGAEAEHIVPELKHALLERQNALRSHPDNLNVNGFMALYNPILDFYQSTSQWKNFAAELQFYQSIYSGSMNIDARLCLIMYKFSLDSVKGDYFTALKGYQRIKTIRDSLTKSRTDKQNNQLDSKLLFVKKESDIDSLNKQAALHKTELDTSNRQKNITISGSLILIAFLGMMYFAYSDKLKSHKSLQVKQDEINKQNTALSTLLNEKDWFLKEKDELLDRQTLLLTEKEWLLREVHHRVKNNLQIINSLLYTQSSYLQNKDAIDAIRNSQNRVQAIAIIHQRLYSKTNVGSVVMADYIKALVQFLCDSYDCKRRKIRFKQMFSHVELDISQAVPMGLILNEAITNAIKYAFTATWGEIDISGTLTDDRTVSLTIVDNGIGLPEDFILAESVSMGMEMMKALTKQLEGIFNISGSSGVLINVVFAIKTPMEVFKDD